MQSWDASYRTSWGRLRGGFCRRAQNLVSASQSKRSVRGTVVWRSHQIQAASPIFFGTSQKSIHLAQQSWGHTILDLWIVNQHYRYRLWRKSGEKTHLGCKKLVNDGRNYQTQLVSRISSIDSKCLDPKKGLALCHPSTSLITKKKADSRHNPHSHTTSWRHRPPDANTTKSFSSGAAGASLSSSNETVLRCPWYLVTGLQSICIYK